MKRVVFIMLLCCGMLSIASSSPAENSLDGLLRILIIGRWVQDSNPYGISTYAKDGRYQARLYRTSHQEELVARLQGTWHIDNARLHVILTDAKPQLIAIGEDITDDIVLINGNEMVLIDSQGERYTKVRAKD